MRRFIVALESFVNHPLFKLLVALGVIVTAGLEVLHETEKTEPAVGAHHGIVVYGLALAVSALAEAANATIEAHGAIESRK